MRVKIQYAVLAVMIGVFLGRIPDTLARKGAYDFFDTVVDIRSEIMRNYVEQPDEKKMLDGAVNGMISTLNDPYTDYFPPAELEDFDKQTRGSFSGIGAEISEQDGHVVIVSPLEDSPAFKSGILAGDIVLEIDGKSADGLRSSEAVKRITGPEGSKVTLKVRHTDGKEQTITITRQRIQIQTVRGFKRSKDQHWDFMLDPDNKIGYIRLTQFSDPSADAMKEAIAELKARGMKGLILDLRFDPGGLLDQAIEISNMFLPKGKIVSTKGRNSPEKSWSADPSDDVGEFPMITMVNEFSASASEILSGALKDNDRSIILGTRSFGKGSVQQVLALESGNGAIKVTTAHYYLPSGRNIHRREGAKEWGVDPTDGYYVPMSTDQMRAMGEVRRNYEIIKAGPEDAPAAKVTPDYVNETLKDPQLAAALKAMINRVATGTFEPVGKSNATLQAHMNEKAELEKRREALIEGLDKVNEKLKDLDTKISQSGGDPKAPAATSAPAADAKPKAKKTGSKKKTPEKK